MIFFIKIKVIGCAVLALAEIGLQADRELEVGQKCRRCVKLPMCQKYVGI